MFIAYLSADQDVYIANRNTWTIYKLSSDGKRTSSYHNTAVQHGNAALAYYHGNIWIAMDGYNQGRPILGRLTPSNKFSAIALPFAGSTYLVSAMVPGPNGHLWYLRGNRVGEILSPI